MKTKNKIFFSFILILVSSFLLFFYFNYWRNNEKTNNQVKIRGQVFSVEKVKTQKAIAKGLSGRKSLCSECGMLFEFSQRGIYSFWMKNMNFKLDIIWIDGDKVVFVAKNVSFSPVETVNPGIRANKVLEINAGISEKIGIKEGDKVEF
jgi:uncharacterized membrane protein (UPF0127 family)